MEDNLDVLDSFEGFPRIPRLSREIVVTEKIDGTNAQIVIRADGTVRAGSRNRWLTVEDDNHHFAAWVLQHEEELRHGLGIGRHYGEWWGIGIGRRYNLFERRFSLFNTQRWSDPSVRPSCCSVVPVLYTGPFCTATIQSIIEGLRTGGSVAAPGFMKPEGVVIFHKASGALFKKTVERDEQHKSQLEVEP